jgi:hypothetical protein
MEYIARTREPRLKAKKLSRSKANANPTRKVKRLPPTAPAARDEGPRLLPLDETTRESSRLEHYLDLADAALGLKKKPPEM